MLELFESAPETGVLQSEYRRLLGFPRRYEPSGRSLELEAWARTWYAEHGRPWYYLREASLEVGLESVRIDHADFESDELRNHLLEAGARRVVVLAVGAGRECEEECRRLWEKAQPDSYFFLEMYASAVVEHLVASAFGTVCAFAESDGLVAVRPYSPGYSGWDVSAQGRLFDLITAGAGSALPGPLEVMESGMLKPKKSQLAILGLAERNERSPVRARLVPCLDCSLSPCAFRRVPYRHDADEDGGERREVSPPPLTGNGRYRVNHRALEKWARERLHLEFFHDRSIEATFRYDGTTCSNMGWPLALEYRVRLSPPEEGLIILQAKCRVAPDDTGFHRMCESINNNDGLLKAMAGGCPLSGRPLDAVLGWDSPLSPAGCICSVENRLHKWRQVFEVIHHALVRSGYADAPADPARANAAAGTHATPY